VRLLLVLALELVPLRDDGFLLPEAGALGIALAELDAFFFVSVVPLRLAPSDELSIPLVAAGAQIGNLARLANDVDQAVAVESRLTVDDGEAAQCDHGFEPEFSARHDGDGYCAGGVVTFELPDKSGRRELGRDDGARNTEGLLERAR